MNLRQAAMLAVSLSPITLAAQGREPFAPVVLSLPGGARTLALGNVGVAGRDDDVLFFNPSQLAIARGTSASVERLSSAAATGSLSSVIRFSTGGVAVGMRMADYEAPSNFFPVNRDSMLNAGPGRGTSVEAAVGLAMVAKNIRFGATAKYVEDNVQSFRAGRAAFDLGVSKDMLRTTWALAVQNLGESMSMRCSIASAAQSGDCVAAGVPLSSQFTTAQLPLKTTLGAYHTRPVGQFDLAATAAVSVLRNGFVTPAGGAELGYSWLDGYSIALRAGGRRPIDGEGAMTAGAGLNIDRLSIDYALETLSRSRVAHRVGLRVR